MTLHVRTSIASLLLVACAALTSPGAVAAPAVPAPIRSDAETEPVSHSGDAMDDPAIWVNPNDPSRSLLIGNDKGGALETYDLDGNRVQRLQHGDEFWGNVDIRQDVTIGGVRRDLVGVVQRTVRFYTIDSSSRLLSPVTEGDAPIGTGGEGFCMYQSPTTNKVYGITITIAGLVRQFELLDADSDGKLESRTVREFSVGSEAEGCVADDRTGALYISEENRGLWRYGAEPGTGSTRQAVDLLEASGGQLVNDVEGVTLVDKSDGTGYVIVSSQNAAAPDASFFNVYRRGAGNDWVANFRVTSSTSSDDCDRTDGITAVTANLGPEFPNGMFVCQDNNNDAPGTVGNQNLKMVRLEKILALDEGVQAPAAPSSLAFAGATTTNANDTDFEVNVPATTRTGDAMLMFVSQGDSDDRVTGAPGWIREGSSTDGSHRTTVWSRVATAADLRSTVRMTTSDGAYVKAALTLAVYTGTDARDPVAAVAGLADTGTTAAHTAPLLNSAEPGALRVSYWSDKSGGTTAWQAPVGEITRAVTSGTGGGHISSLLTDPGVPLKATGSTGGLTSTADDAAAKATSWTVLLRPAD